MLEVLAGCPGTDAVWKLKQKEAVVDMATLYTAWYGGGWATCPFLMSQR